MKRKYVAFDLETAKDVPGADFNWRSHRPLGISCAATLSSEAEEPTIWHGLQADGAPAARMSTSKAKQLVDNLVEMVSQGYTLLTWNGLGFDLDVLAEESDSWAECRKLATDHVDMMFHSKASVCSVASGVVAYDIITVEIFVERRDLVTG